MSTMTINFPNVSCNAVDRVPTRGPQPALPLPRDLRADGRVPAATQGLRGLRVSFRSGNT